MILSEVGGRLECFYPQVLSGLVGTIGFCVIQYFCSVWSISGILPRWLASSRERSELHCSRCLLEWGSVAAQDVVMIFVDQMRATRQDVRNAELGVRRVARGMAGRLAFLGGMVSGDSRWS